MTYGDVHERVMAVILEFHDGGVDRVFFCFGMEDELFGAQEKAAGTISRRELGGVEADGAENATGLVGLDVGCQDVGLADEACGGDVGGFAVEGPGIGSGHYVALAQYGDLVG